MDVESLLYFALLCFTLLCFTLLCDWSRKLAPLSQPIRFKTKTNHARFFPRFRQFCCLDFKFSLVLKGSFLYFDWHLWILGFGFRTLDPKRWFYCYSITKKSWKWKKLSKPLHCRQLLPHCKVWRTSSQLISSSPFLMPRTNKISRIGIKFIGHIYFLKNMRYIFLLNSDSRSCIELYEYHTYKNK